MLIVLPNLVYNLYYCRSYHQKRTAKRERVKRASTCVCPVWTIGRAGVVEAKILSTKFWNFGFWQPSVRSSLCRSLSFFFKFIFLKLSQNYEFWKIWNLVKIWNLKQNTDSPTGNWVEMKSLPPQTIVHWPDPPTPTPRPLLRGV